MNNYFRVLGVKSNASENDIKKPIVGCRTSTIPTSCTGEEEEKEQAAARLHQVKQAYEVLSDPKQRAAFSGFQQRHRDRSRCCHAGDVGPVHP